MKALDELAAVIITAAIFTAIPAAALFAILVLLS